MELIGLTGPGDGGTQTVARHLAEQHNFAHLRFDDPVRDMLAALLQLARERIDVLLLDPQWRERPLSHTGLSPHRLLHSLSADWGRRTHRDLWISLLRQRLAFICEDLPYEYDGVVISDVHFDNEAHFVRDHGILVHVARPELAPAVPLVGDTVKFQSRDEILLNLGSGSLTQHIDHLMQTLRARQVA